VNAVPHNREMLLSWQANIDVQLIGEQLDVQIALLFLNSFFIDHCTVKGSEKYRIWLHSTEFATSSKVLPHCVHVNQEKNVETWYRARREIRL
jgi:hypothetical protein